MSSQLVIHTSQWMMGFHPFFLDNPNTITSLQAPHTDYLFLSHSTLATHRPRINRNRTRYGAVFPSLLDALIYASRHDDTNHITLLHKDDCVLIDPNQDPLTNPIVMPSRITEELSSRPDCGIMALRLDSLSVAHSTAHIAPLLLNNLRPLTCAPHDATMVSIPIGDYTFSLMSICDAFEWMGHTALLRAPCKSGPIRIICDASLQKQVHPHLLHQYIERNPTPDNNLRPPSRWPVLQKHTHSERATCMTTPNCLIWVFLFQPPSNEEEFLRHRWILART